MELRPHPNDADKPSKRRGGSTAASLDGKELYERKEAGESVASLAKEKGVSKMTVYNKIKEYKTR